MTTETTYNLLAGFGFSAKVEANNSTTINITTPTGNIEWNSGVWIGCYAVSQGAAITVTILSEGNTNLGRLTSFLVTKGCVWAVKSLPSSGHGGGDSGTGANHGDPSGGSGGPNPPNHNPKTGDVIVKPMSIPGGSDLSVAKLDLSLANLASSSVGKNAEFASSVVSADVYAEHSAMLDQQSVTLVGVADPLHA